MVHNATGTPPRFGAQRRLSPLQGPLNTTQRKATSTQERGAIEGRVGTVYCRGITYSHTKCSTTYGSVPKGAQDLVGLFVQKSHCTNSSYITVLYNFKPPPHLDKKHTILGKLVGAIKILSTTTSLGSRSKQRFMQQVTAEKKAGDGMNWFGSGLARRALDRATGRSGGGVGKYPGLTVAAATAEPIKRILGFGEFEDF
ncbi:hypothetical protein BJY52DRAFT_1415217 [Lactarius psammicola]|nr:hypothetical protein BJY52DRAFT_1415217 [Lactarius psammicola]